jgi:sulfur relay (sulfurtransferase) DsrC/TusE family protein
MIDRNFNKILEGTERHWEVFRLAVDNFLVNSKAPNYRRLVKLMLEAYRATRYNISLKISLFNSH